MKDITITTGRNGYPSGLHDGFIGFKSYDEAEAFAKENDGEVVELRQRYGWSLWESRGAAYEPLELGAEDYGDDYTDIRSLSQCDYETEEIISELEADGESQEVIEAMKAQRAEIREAVAALGEDEAVLLYRGEFSEIIKTSCMSYELDSWRHAIGVEIKREEE